MFKKNLLTTVVALGFYTATVSAQETLVVDTWGGSFRDLIDEAIAQQFTEETGVEVVYNTGGTIDRLNKAKLAGSAESDVTFTTSHVGWMYVNDGLFEELDMSKIPNAEHLVDQARISPSHLGVWGYGYTIAYRPDLIPEGIAFDSWEDLWDPQLEDSIALPDFDPSHIIAVSALLSGSDAENWEDGQEKLESLKPNLRAFYTNDANSQQLISTGETPVQLMLTMNAHHMMSEGIPIELAQPKEGMVLGVDTVGVTKGSSNQELAHQFINIALSPEVQARIAEVKHGSPTVDNAEISDDLADSPAMLSTPEQWAQTIDVDPRLRAQKMGEWRQWFTENIMN
ncbi:MULTISPECIES: polyamine ABC transporter substrate-binding protein [Halomonadaceae]|uniref:Polyamine ABC transporter substrate-binding protein n=2 Tax=Vreelandella TaxID=3137766 RepID=A0A7Z0LWG5_9GAMM|nr:MULTISPECIES: polyamine ABC transporter substrate-binding protein [Halomonas]NYS79940.1 polyamine ABC transporter substrate-binding protein [Halomonas glaciei]